MRSPPDRSRWLAGALAALFAVALVPAAAGEGSDSAGGSGGAVEWSGHFKLQGVAASFPDDSIFRDLLGADAQDAILDLRLNFSASAGGWDFAADGQLIAILGDTLEAPLPFRDLALLTGASALIGDDLRLFDLTSVHHDEGRSAFLTRLDRLSIGYTGKRGAVRFGRQAITWGNGFVFTPMDIFNPFDPTAVDKEYKTGDDMLYGQLLTSRDDDLQGVVVFRRDAETGDVESEAGSAALKYHGVLGRGEIDLLAARHFGDSLFGVGGNRSLGGAVWRGDAVVTVTDETTVVSLVTSGSYSWVLGGKNVTGIVEYFRNGFGQSGGRYSLADLESNPDLVARVLRGELFTLARNYLAASLTIEVTPLFQLTPNVFTNLDDPSALVQIVTQNDLAQDLLLRGALAIPVGPDGSELGGIEAVAGRYLALRGSVWIQLAWYF